MPSESTSPAERRSPIPRESLPPVSPPSPGFIMQLFVIPLIIVTMIIGIWLLIHWAVNHDMRPAQLANDIERLNHASWQQALTLANQLRDSRDATLRTDRELCQRLAQQLQQRIAEGGINQERVWLRIYLCRALGEFEIADGVPALLDAASHQQHDKDVEIRRAALQALLLLNERLESQRIFEEPAVVEAALGAATARPPELAGGTTMASNTDELAAEEQALRYARLRSTAALVLGLVADPQSVVHLAVMLDDDSQDVRYNAAVALARHGDPSCVPVLVHMLNAAGDLDDVESAMVSRRSFSADEVSTWQAFKRNWVITEGLQAMEFYVAANPTADVAPLQSAVERLQRQDAVPKEIHRRALATFQRLSKSDG